MNPWGLIFISLGLLMIIIGFKGSQHSVMDAFKGASPGGKSKKKTPPSLDDHLKLQPPKLA